MRQTINEAIMIPIEVVEKLKDMQLDEANKLIEKNTVSVTDNNGTELQLVALVIENGELVSKLESSSEELLELAKKRDAEFKEMMKDKKTRKNYLYNKEKAIINQMMEIEKSGKTPIRMGDSIEILDVNPIDFRLMAKMTRWSVYEIVYIIFTAIGLIPLYSIVGIALFSIINLNLGYAIIRSMARYITSE